jgi:hypothetical protein
MRLKRVPQPRPAQVGDKPLTSSVGRLRAVTCPPTAELGWRCWPSTNSETTGRRPTVPHRLRSDPAAVKFPTSISRPPRFCAWTPEETACSREAVAGQSEHGEQRVTDGAAVASVKGEQRGIVADRQCPAHVAEVVGEHPVEEVDGDDER